MYNSDRKFSKEFNGQKLPTNLVSFLSRKLQKLSQIYLKNPAVNFIGNLKK